MAKEKQEKDELLTSLKEINKVFGENAVIRVGDVERPKINLLSTGVPSFDYALGGGFGEGRIVEIYGMQSSGKTTLSLMTIAEAQKRGKVCGFIDAEQSMNFEYAEFLGVDIDKLVVSQVAVAEDALEILDKLIKTGHFDLIVFDSVASISPRKEVEGEMGDQTVGVVAKLMSQAMRKIVSSANQNNTTVIFINQMRSLIGTYVPMKTTTGGNGLKFASSQRVEVIKGKDIKEGDNVIGYKMKIKVAKNKIASPFKTAEIDNLFGQKFDADKDYINLAYQQGIITRKGSWYSYKDSNLAQGLDKTADLVLENPELFDEIKSQLKLK